MGRDELCAAAPAAAEDGSENLICPLCVRRFYKEGMRNLTPYS
jgi:hypothetical protein